MWIGSGDDWYFLLLALGRNPGVSHLVIAMMLSGFLRARSSALITSFA